MTQENKLRKFKLIDRVGFISNADGNESLVEQTDILEGYIFYGELYPEPSIDESEAILILQHEVKFFKEITEEGVVEEEEEDFVPIMGEPCEASRADDLETWFKFIPRAKYKPHYRDNECYVGDVQSEEVSWKVDQFHIDHYVFRPIKKKTWQETLSEEFDLDYSTLGFGFHHTMTEERTIEFGKRILELSGED